MRMNRTLVTSAGIVAAVAGAVVLGLTEANAGSRGKGARGGGGSDLTWQLFGGVGYQVCPSSSLLLGYRYMSYDYQEGGFIYDIDTKGPIMGLRIAF